MRYYSIYFSKFVYIFFYSLMNKLFKYFYLIFICNNVFLDFFLDKWRREIVLGDDRGIS